MMPSFLAILASWRETLRWVTGTCDVSVDALASMNAFLLDFMPVECFLSCAW